MAKIITTNEKGFGRYTRFRHKWLILVSIVVLLAAVGGGYYWWVSHKTTPTAKQTAQTPVVNTGIPIKKPAEYQTALAKATKTADKITLLQGLITAQQLAGDVPGALKTAQELITLDQSASSYAILGGLYRATGQKTQAIDAYKKAVELTPATSADVYSDYNVYKQALASLQGGN